MTCFFHYITPISKLPIRDVVYFQCFIFSDIFESFGGFGAGGDFTGFSAGGRSRGFGRPGHPHGQAMEFEDIPFGMNTGRQKQDPPIEYKLNVSLEEVLTGTTKKMKVSRRVLTPDGAGVYYEDKVLEIQVKRGWKEGTKITFPKEGHQAPGKIPADIVFIINDKPHPIFKRDGDNNLICKARISLRVALTGGYVAIKTIDGRSLNMSVTDIVRPGMKKVIPGEGLPLPKQPDVRADLHLEYDIEFPTQLNGSQKEALRNVLPYST